MRVEAYTNPRNLWSINVSEGRNLWSINVSEGRNLWSINVSEGRYLTVHCITLPPKCQEPPLSENPHNSRAESPGRPLNTHT